MATRTLRYAALIGALTWLALASSPVAAFPLSGGCTLSLVSVDANGAAIGAADAGDEFGTLDHPLEVDWAGGVGWTGGAGGSVTSYTYHVDVYGIPTPLRGEGVQSSGNPGSNGAVLIEENLPFRITGLYHVSGGYTYDGGSCSGSGWIRLRGDPVGTVGFGAAIAAALAGLVLIATSLGGRHTLRGLVGGLLGGVGLALGAATFGAAPAGELTPLAALGFVALVGLGVGALAPGGQGSQPSPPQQETVCQELAARLRTMKDSRERRLHGIQQGMTQLENAYGWERYAAYARQSLSYQHAQAMGLLGGAAALAGGAAASVFGALAAAATATGDALSSAVGWVIGGGEAAIDYIPVMAAAGEPEIGLGLRAVQVATSRATAAYTEAAALYTGAGASGLAAAGGIDRIESLLSGAMRDVDEATARAQSIRARLEAALRDSLQQLAELDALIGETLNQLHACPGMDPGSLVDPRTPPPAFPDPAGPTGQPPRG